MAESIIESIEKFGLSRKKKSAKLFSKVGIVGCGNDGQYIARVCSSYGMDVIFLESSNQKITESLNKIEAMMDSRILNWGATESEKRAVMSRIVGTLAFEDFKECDLVIETVPTTGKGRSFEARKEVFEKLEEVVYSNCIIATNSTAVIISDLAENLENKKRCISLHFMINSVDSRIVEITKGLHTSDWAYEKVIQFIKMIKRKAIPVEESVGLISVRMFCVFLNEACEMVLEGVACKEDVEELMLTGYGMRFGPFTIADIIGLEKTAQWMENLFNEFGDARYKPNPLIKRLIRHRFLGKSTGQGFFKYYEAGLKQEETKLEDILK
jgi:3-hydroxybutyryl-CoA dehydrogenase